MHDSLFPPRRLPYDGLCRRFDHWIDNVNCVRPPQEPPAEGVASQGRLTDEYSNASSGHKRKPKLGRPKGSRKYRRADWEPLELDKDGNEIVTPNTLV